MSKMRFCREKFIKNEIFDRKNEIFVRRSGKKGDFSSWNWHLDGHPDIRTHRNTKKYWMIGAKFKKIGVLEGKYRKIEILVDFSEKKLIFLRRNL